MPSNARSWTIDGDPFLCTPEDLADEMNAAAVLLSRVGGAIVCAAQRKQITKDHWITTGYAFTWRSYVPADRLPPEEIATVVPDPEPVAA